MRWRVEKGDVLGWTLSNKRINIHEKCGIKVLNSIRVALIMDKMNNNTLWVDTMTNAVSALDRLSLYQYYPPKTKFENNSCCRWSPMRVVFDIKQQYFRQKSKASCCRTWVGLIITYHIIIDHQVHNPQVNVNSSNKNGLRLMYGDIGNAFCMALCSKKVFLHTSKNLVQNMVLLWS